MYLLAGGTHLKGDEAVGSPHVVWGHPASKAFPPLMTTMMTTLMTTMMTIMMLLLQVVIGEASKQVTTTHYYHLAHHPKSQNIEAFNDTDHP